MPRKKKASQEVPAVSLGRYHVPSDAPWGGFINIKVTEDERAVFEAWWLENRTHIWTALEDLLGEGMKVSFSYDAENECHTVSFTGSGWVESQSRWCMTSRAGSLDETIALAVWKHVVLSDCDWGDYRPKTGRKAAWG